MDRITKIIALSLLLSIGFGTLQLKAQHEDFEVWSSFNFRFDITKGINVQLEEGFRFDKNASRFHQHYTNLDLHTRFSKYVRVGLGYRLIQIQNQEGYFNVRHRLAVETRLKYDFDRLRIAYRIRYQNKMSPSDFLEYNFYPTNVLRHKLALNYNIKGLKLNPFIEAELFSQLKNRGNTLTKLRYTIGFDYGISKMIDLDVFYMIEPEYNSPNPLTAYILGFGLSFHLINK